LSSAPQLFFTHPQFRVWQLHSVWHSHEQFSQGQISPQQSFGFTMNSLISFSPFDLLSTTADESLPKTLQFRAC
jgi:hypothetical protein